MLYRNYFNTAWRNLLKDKSFSAINISGLALGMACSLLIVLWVLDEQGIDAFHANDSRLYMVYEQQHYDGIVNGSYATPGLLAEDLKQVYPEVEYSTGMAWPTSGTFEANGKIVKQAGDYGSADFFSIFSFPLLAGTKETALKRTTDIAISRKMAGIFFGSADAALGQSLRYENRMDLKVSAVFEDLPPNSSMKFDYMLSWETFQNEQQWSRNWGNNASYCFIVLKEGADVSAFGNKLYNFLDRHPDAQNETFKVKLGLQKYSEQYLHSEFENGKIAGGRMQYVNLFSMIAVFIVLIACINFMNLTTARSIKRGKEIGIRKVVGAVRGALIRQFIGEAILITAFAFVVGLLLVSAALPVFNIITQKQIQIPFDQGKFWIVLAAVILAIGFISGSYPALYLSGFNPVHAFKGTLRFGGAALWFRKGLVVFQFMLSIMLIVGTIVVSRQVRYVQSVHLGYDRERLIYVPVDGPFAKKYQAFKDELQRTPGIKLVSCIDSRPTRIVNGTGGVTWEGKDPNAFVDITQVAIGYDFIRTMGIELLQGRDFSPEFKSDTAGYIVNETAWKLFNYKNPIGMPLTLWGMKGTIVGVVKDFHINSLHVEIKPLMLRLDDAMEGGWALIRLEPGKTNVAMASIKRAWKEFNPYFPLDYQFSDQEYQKLYASEQVIEKLSNAFAVMAVFISCLGLLGLAIFTTGQRTKEIGIRKILGASLVSLFNLLSKELLILISLAIVIASPVAWYIMNDWLNGYAYRIDITIGIFILAGLLAIAIALITISFQTLKALFANPVKSLRTE